MNEKLIEIIKNFRDERNWKQFHNPKDLAISISLEAAELLEAFQWSGEDTTIDGRIESIEEELADIIIYCVLMAEASGLNIDEIVKKKISRNSEKYPVEKSYGNRTKYSDFE